MGIMKKLTKLMAAVLMAVMLTGILPVAAHAAGREAKVTSYMLNVRAGAAQEYTIIDVAYEGNTMDVLEELPNGWVKVRFNGQEGWVSSLFLSIYDKPEPTASQTYEAAETAVEQAAPAATPEPTAAPPKALSASGQAVVDTAMKYQGIPYRWAGTSPESGFDCSGLVYYVYKQHGVTLNRVAQSMAYNGTEVDLNSLQPGDILLFGSSVYNIWHAGIYIGNGQFIHAPHSGAVVSTQSIAGTYGMRLVAARRIF